MAILTTTEFKTIYNINSSTDDSRIELLIPVIDDFILKYCSITIEEAESTPSLKIVAAQLLFNTLYNSKGIASENIGNYSYSLLSDVNKPILSILNNYRKVEFF